VALIVVLAPPTLPSVELVVDVLLAVLTVALALVCTAVVVGPTALVCVTVALVPPIPPMLAAGSAGSAVLEQASSETTSIGIAHSSLSHMIAVQGAAHRQRWQPFLRMARLCSRLRALSRESADTRSSNGTLQWRIT
jgi:hypothetical protein